MLHLIYDPDDYNYMLLETKGPNTAFIYRNDNNNCWLPLMEHLTSTQQTDTAPENFREWKGQVKFSFIYSARTLSAIHKFIHKHPELAI